jgi:hypothetical protein
MTPNGGGGDPDELRELRATCQRSIRQAFAMIALAAGELSRRDPYDAGAVMQALDSLEAQIVVIRQLDEITRL